MPVSDASVSALKKYLSIFSDGDSVAAAQSQLAEQQKQLADPAFRARAQGLAAVDSGMAGKAIPELQQAVRANPKDSEALGALGQGVFSERRSRQCSGESGKSPRTGPAQQQQRQMEQSAESKPLLAGDPAGAMLR